MAPEKVRLLYNGIDPEPFLRVGGERERAREALRLEPEAFVVVALGNLHSYKGHPDLIRAAAMAGDRLAHPWHLVIAGRDEQGNRACYEELIADLGLAEHVTLFGPCSNVPQLLFAADLFVQPSHHEGLPNAIIEAMAASLPVVGSAVGGIPEVIRALSADATVATETGWLIPPRDPAALAEVLIEAAADASRRERMGARARTRVVEEFSLARSVASYEGIYREITSHA